MKKDRWAPLRSRNRISPALALSRLAAMQRADKNIDELLEDLNGTFHRLRQSGIDEELFDVISGFEELVRRGSFCGADLFAFSIRSEGCISTPRMLSLRSGR